MTAIEVSPLVMVMVAHFLEEAAQERSVPEHARAELAALSKAIIESTRADETSTWRLTREVKP